MILCNTTLDTIPPIPKKPQKLGLRQEFLYLFSYVTICARALLWTPGTGTNWLPREHVQFFMF